MHPLTVSRVEQASLMSEDGVDLRNAALYAGVAAAAGLALGGLGYYVYGRWVYNPPVPGELLLETTAPGLLREFRYHQWWGCCDKKAFRRVLQRPLQQFLTRVVVDLVQTQARRITGEAEGLTRSQLLVEHAWIGQLINELAAVLEERLEVELPEHFVDQVFRLFDADADGKITKKEFVSKVTCAVRAVSKCR